MAQKTENEETEFKVVTETITLCVNNCGVIGNPATNNMCQKCFNSSTSTSTSISNTTSSSSATVEFKFGEKSPRSRSSPVRTVDRAEARRDLKREDSSTARDDAKESSSTPTTPSVMKREVNRCSGCRRKVGLTGFRCRCGELFCAEHRYSDRHDCSYDYKAAGREAIARENPVVKAAKIVKKARKVRWRGAHVETRCWGSGGGDNRVVTNLEFPDVEVWGWNSIDETGKL